MPMHLKGGFKSKNGLVTYGMGGSKKKMTYGHGGSLMRKREMMRASKGLEALAAANPELTYTGKKEKKMYGGVRGNMKKKDMMMYGGGMGKKKKMMYGGMSKKKKMM